MLLGASRCSPFQHILRPREPRESMVFALQRAAAETTSFQTHPQDPQGGVTVTP